MQYRNITISGLPGSGSTTLLKLLKSHFKEQWQGFSGGDFMRSYALEKGLFHEQGKLHHDSSHYEDDFDRAIDMGMREKLEHEQHWILESWLSGFIAQEVPQVLKVLLYCSDDAVRVDRIVNRDGVSVEEAKENMQKRTQNNVTKWTRMYSQEWKNWVVAKGKANEGEKIDFWKPNLYDVCIDTYSKNKEETLSLVLQALNG